jgi:hypothetical protein
MITFDFFECNKDKLLTSFCQYFSLNYLTTKEYFERANRETIDEETVIKELGLNLNNFESSKVSMIGKHMTTTNIVGIESFKNKGILNLKRMLKDENNLTKIMREFGIVIDYDNYLINIEDTQYPLNISMGSCEVCLKGNDKICSKYFGCEFKKKLYHLALKLYKYKGTTEFFISGTLKDMKRYSTIDRYPEILETLAQLIGEQKSKSYPDYSICHEWIKEHPLCIVIEFVVKLSEIETFNPISSNDWFNAYESCLDFCDYSYDDFINNNIPKKIFDNLYIIRLFNSFYFWGNSENYGSLLEDQIVSPENIVSIIEV